MPSIAKTHYTSPVIAIYYIVSWALAKKSDFEKTVVLTYREKFNTESQGKMNY